MPKVIMFPGLMEVDADIERDLNAILDWQSDLLARWKVFGEELQRRAEHPLPIGLEIELHDLLNETEA